MRLHYIDVYKGVCILLVVIHHIPFVIGNLIPGSVIWGIQWIQNFIMGFFMPAFFVATGRCTNFSVPFKQFLWKNIKTILFPCFCLYYINHWLSCLNALCFTDATWVTWSHFFSLGVRTFLREGGYYWFLPALFFSKVFYYLIVRYTNRLYSRFLFSLVLSLLSIVMIGLWPEYNYFFWQHALLLLVFLFAGELLKQYEKHIVAWGHISLLSYIVTILFFTILQFNVPSVTRTIDVSLTSYVLFLLFAISGTIGVWWICSSCIVHNSLLEYWGKNSIVLYAFNYIVSVISVNALLCICEPSSILGITLLFVISVILDLILLSALSWLLNKKLLRILLGQF